MKKTTTKSGRVSLSVVQGYRDGGRVRQRTIQTFGFVDELERRFEDPVQHFQGIVARMNADRQVAGRAQQLSVHPGEELPAGAERRLECGGAVPLAYLRALGAESAARSLCNANGSAPLLRLMALQALIAPWEERPAWELAGRYPIRFGLTNDEISLALVSLAEMAGEIAAVIGRGSAEAGPKATSTGFWEAKWNISSTRKAIVRIGGAAQLPLSFDLRWGHVAETSKNEDPSVGADGEFLAPGNETLLSYEEQQIILAPLTEELPLGVTTQIYAEAAMLSRFAALCALRSISHALGGRWSPAALLCELRSLGCSDAGEGWWLFNHHTALTDELFALIGERAPRMWMRRTQIKALFSRGKEVAWGAA